VFQRFAHVKNNQLNSFSWNFVLLERLTPKYKEICMQKILKNPVNYAVCETFDHEEILNRVQNDSYVDSAVCPPRKILDVNEILNQVQNDSYEDFAVCHPCKLDDMEKSLDQVQNDDEVVAELDKPNAETLTRISNFREAQIEILPSHRERGVFARLFHTLQGKEILNQLMTSSTHTGSGDSSLVASLCKVQNDSYGDLAVCHPCELGDMKKSKILHKKAAFTLAEVLIVIAVVGVVSALTIPTLIKNYQQKQTIIRLKKVYSVLNQAVRESQQDNGDSDDWDFSLSDEEVMNKYFAPYIKISKVKGTSYSYTDLAGGEHTSIMGVYRFTNVLYALPDGAYVARIWAWAFGERNHLLVDINGGAGPNHMGRDVFAFTLWNNQLMPYSSAPSANMQAFCRYNSTIYNGGTTGQCNKSAQGGIFGAGSNCSSIIICNNWQFPPNYPW
jgi:prepilin-type N-terminal cleavage/methylation domain-containing protein